MKAVVQTRYGSPDVLKTIETEKPVPNGHQVLIKVNASSINAVEWRTLQAKPFIMRLMIGGLFKPKNPRIGTDVAGIVKEVGESAIQFRPGDLVFGCAKGAFAEYVLAKDTYLALKPFNISFETAAAVPVAALTALQGIRFAGGIQPGQKVLVQGASGGVGSFTLQLAKHYGAEVTAVVSKRNLEMARSLGADHVEDYTHHDILQDKECYDLIFAVNGYHSIFAYRRALKPQGVYVCAGGTMLQIFQSMLLGGLLSKAGGKKLGNMGISRVTQEDLGTLGKLLEAGKIHPVIDRIYSLAEIVEAMRYVVDIHPQGKVVIKVPA
jgi:NADPH:quinone reductase-like Zn-dependent oxidoreductase